MSRALTDREIALAASMFGEAIDYGRVGLSTRWWGRSAIAFGSAVTFPPWHPPPEDFADAQPETQAWLIHELTHVWQFQTMPLWTIGSWAAVVLQGGYRRGLPGYRYGWPLKPWMRHNLEQQASIVEHAFLLRQTGRCSGAPAGATLEGYARCVPLTGAPDRPA